MQVDLDEVGLAGIAVEAGGALDVDPEDIRRKSQETFNSRICVRHSSSAGGASFGARAQVGVMSCWELG